MLKTLSLTITLTCCSATVLAEDYFSLPEPWSYNAAAETQKLMLASNDGYTSAKKTSRKTPASNTEFNERMFTSNKIHQYLGIGSMAAAIGTALSPKEEDGAHENLGNTAAALGVAAVITGFLFHWDEIKLSNGFDDPDNLHMALTTLGTLGYLAATDKAPESGHGGTGSIGGISMAIGIKMAW